MPTRALRDVLRGGGRHAKQLPRRSGGHREKGTVLFVLLRQGNHYWYTPEVGGKVYNNNLTRFGRALKHLGIEMIAAYLPESRGRTERLFRTHQGRLLAEKPQIPPDKYRCHYIKAKVRVHRYNDGTLGIFHGPKKLAVYDPTGNLDGNTLRATA